MHGSTRPKIPRRMLDGVLLLDKPLGLSSNDALIRAKKIYLAKKAGHTGTLDPLATGLLPLCFGEATKFSRICLKPIKPTKRPCASVCAQPRATPKAKRCRHAM